MQDSALYNKFPYNSPGYDSRFVNRGVIVYLQDFCASNPYIEEFFAKGSIIHGCMIEGSDIDHVRIRVNRQLEADEKICLVDDLEEGLYELGVCGFKRVREDGYARVFYDWKELKILPNACNRKCELYPNLHVLTAEDNQDWLEKVIRTGKSYAGKSPPDWIERMRQRILI